MSLINKVLRELDERQALAGQAGAQPPGEVRVVAETQPGGREWFWRTLAVLMLASVGWVGWVAWQMRPSAFVTEDGLKAGEKARRAAPGAQASAQPVAGTAAPAPSALPGAPAERSPAPVAEALAQAEPDRGSAAVQPLRLAAAIESPIEEKPAAAALPPEPRPPAAAAGKSPPVTPTESAASPAAAKPPVREPRELRLDVPQARILAAPERGAARLERREREPSPPERAEREFRRAVALLREGRPGEAEQPLAAAIGLDPGHAAARQTLAALKLERGELQAALALLEGGLALVPSNIGFAVAAARIHMERRDALAALALLEPLRRELLGNPQHAQLLAAVEQRLGRYREAAEALRAVLAAQPENGAAWAALGVALEALGARPEAAEAYRRALAAGGLAAEAQAHAEARVRALR